LCFTINSKHLHCHAAALLGQNSTRHNVVRLGSRGGEWVHAIAGPLRFGVLYPIQAPDIKHRRTVALDVPMAQAQTN